jgi:hypothetical protein
MSIHVEIPDALAARLEDEAARRGITVEALAHDVLRERYGVPSADGDEMERLKGFIGCLDSGDPTWARTDTHILRSEADAGRRPA